MTLPACGELQGRRRGQATACLLCDFILLEWPNYMEAGESVSLFAGGGLHSTERYNSRSNLQRRKFNTCSM